MSMFRSCSRVAFGAAVLVACCGQAHAQFRGVSTSTDPYLLPVQPWVQTYSIFTVGNSDIADGLGGSLSYRMAGICDGLGAFANSDGSNNYTLLMNHEMGASAGVTRAHGQKGSFVSNWTIDRSTSGPDAFRVRFGRDHVQASAGFSGAYQWNTTTSSYDAASVGDTRTQWDRYCSGDLASNSALYNPASGKGTQNKIYFAGEETRPPFATRHGAGYAFIASGPAQNTAWELPRLGKSAIENILLAPKAQDKTIAMVMDDSDRSTATTPNPGAQPSEVYMYVGNKQSTGNDIERGGLTNGTLYGLKVTVPGDTGAEHETNVFGGTSGGTITSANFSMYDLGNRENSTGQTLQNDSIANNIFRFQRIEDGAWDPRAGHENEFYFLTTADATRQSRLWKMTYSDINNPEAGGTIEMLLQSGDALLGASGALGTTGAQSPLGARMMDNMCVDKFGNVLITEDPGNNEILSRVILYTPGSDTATVIAQVDRSVFDDGGASYIGSQDEEISGIIDASDIMGDGWFLLDVQAHTNLHIAPGLRTELVEGGQLIAIKIPAPAATGILALAGIAAARRRRR